MPDSKFVIPALVAAALLMALVGLVSWMLTHPTAILLLLLFGVGAVLAHARRRRTRDRV